jgi:hypothetical protein
MVGGGAVYRQTDVPPGVNISILNLEVIYLWFLFNTMQEVKFFIEVHYRGCTIFIGQYVRHNVSIVEGERGGLL